MTSAFLLDQALAYARIVPVFPCANKLPLTGEGGFHNATKDPSVITAWWTRWPGAQIGMPTGAVSGRWVLDTDIKPGFNGEQALASLESRNTALPEAPTVRTPSGGFHRHFRAPGGVKVKCTARKVGDGIDVRGDGGYVILPPSAGYEWSEFDDLVPPDAPTWLLALVVDNGPERAERIEDLDVWPEGSRNHRMTSMAGRFRRLGASQRVIAAALKETNQEKCRPLLSNQELERVAASVSRYEPDQVTIAMLEAWWLGTLVEAGPAASGPIIDPGPFPGDLLTVPGIIWDLTTWINATSFKRQPILALAASIAAVGVLAGRRVRTEADTRTNVYCLGVCESGGGKGRARKAIKKLFQLAGCADLLGPEELASDAGLVEAIAGAPNPCKLFQLDEMGRLLKTMNDAARSPHLYGVITTLLKLYSEPGEIWNGKGYADAGRNRTINQPHAVLYGTTVPKSLWEGLTTDAVTDGFLSRMLVFPVDEHDPPTLKPKAIDPPTDLVEATKAWTRPLPGGNLSAANPVAQTVERSQEAEVLFDELDGVVRAERARLKGHDVGTLWTRAVEKADQLALVYACSRGGLLRIDADAARWGIALASYLTRRTIYEASQHLSRNAHEGESNRVVRAIRTAPEGLTRRDLLRRFRHLKAKELLELLSSLQESGDIHLSKVTTGGRAASVYKTGAAIEEGSQIGGTK